MGASTPHIAANTPYTWPTWLPQKPCFFSRRFCGWLESKESLLSRSFPLNSLPRSSRIRFLAGPLLEGQTSSRLGSSLHELSEGLPIGPHALGAHPLDMRWFAAWKEAVERSTKQLRVESCISPDGLLTYLLRRWLWWVPVGSNHES